MNDRINKTSICSIVFLDIIDYSKKPDAEQMEVKNQFNALINHALKDIAQNDRIIVDAGDGAAIACSGSPEDALFIALAIRDEILKNNAQSQVPMFVRFGINLGTVRVVSDINSRPNIIGDGINVAQRIMSFAKPNQILVSRSYFEITSRLSQEISQMFDYSGVKQDKHVREHEVYSVRLQKDILLSNGRSGIPAAAEQANATTSKPSNWKYAVVGIPLLAALVGLVKMNAEPKSPAITLVNPVEQVKPAEQVALAKPSLTTSTDLSAPPANNADKQALMPNETIESIADIARKNDNLATSESADKQAAEDKAKLKATKKKAKREESGEMPPEFVLPHKDVAENPHVADKTAKPVEHHAEKTKEKSGWQGIKDSVTNGADNKCTQAQIAMNQCR
jgi:Adenylate and Guanylate cyclase catalytic domain